MTLTVPIYKWGRLNRLIRRWRGAPGTIEGETPDAKKADFVAKAKGSRGIVDGYATLKLQISLMMAMRLLGRGPVALKTSIDDAFGTFEWGLAE